MNTTKLATLSSTRAAFDEIITNIHLFEPHDPLNINYRHSGALRECVTYYFNGRGSLSEVTSNQITGYQGTDTLCLTWAAVVEAKNLINPLRNIGRAYVTMLSPNGQIYPHADQHGHDGYFDRVDRYQLFFDSNSDLINLVDGIRYMPASDELWYLEHDKVHQYTNNGNRPIVFAVFDLFKY